MKTKKKKSSCQEKRINAARVLRELHAPPEERTATERKRINRARLVVEKGRSKKDRKFLSENNVTSIGIENLPPFR